MTLCFAESLSDKAAQIWSEESPYAHPASADNTLKLWEAATGAEIRTLAGHTDEVNRTAFSPGGKTLASASDDNTLKLWWAVQQHRLSELEEPTDVDE